MKNIAIIGAGGLAREIAFLIEQINKHQATWNILGFVEADDKLVGATIGKYKVFCSEEQLATMEASVVVGIGSPSAIRRVVDKFMTYKNLDFPNLVHPSTIWDKERVELGAGNLICAGNVLTTDIRFGSFNLLNLNCTVGHDARIGDCCVVNPTVSISGGVQIGNECLIGSGATLLQNLTLGDQVTVGAGAVVTKHVEAGKTVAGVPAKVLG